MRHDKRQQKMSLVLVLLAAFTLVFDAPGILALTRVFAPEAEARGGGGPRGGGGGFGGGAPHGGGGGAPRFGAPPPGGGGGPRFGAPPPGGLRYGGGPPMAPAATVRPPAPAAMPRP
ncbi:hypothetical protein, partial [Desulfovibrio sp. TomC]|uniref:hypothetical protein n=1 Tax=Desulfovibrio sp. TomC TaxID=1562888 RepID=UPI0018CD558D